MKRKPAKPKKESTKDNPLSAEFNHSWLVGTLKGHTAPVSNLSMSPNDHYLASAAEGESCKQGLYLFEICVPIPI